MHARHKLLIACNCLNIYLNETISRVLGHDSDHKYFFMQAFFNFHVSEKPSVRRARKAFKTLTLCKSGKSFLPSCIKASGLRIDDSESIILTLFMRL